MTDPSSVLRRRLLAEDGGVAVEYVLWTPMILALLLLIADASAAFLAQGALWQAAGDVSRAIATGRLSPEEAAAFVQAGAGYQMEFRQHDGFVAVRLSRPFDGIGTGVMLSLMGDMEVMVLQQLEPGVLAGREDAHG